MRAPNSFTPIDDFSASTGAGSDNIYDAGQILGQYNILSNGLVGTSPLGNFSLTWAGGFAAAPLTGNMGSLGAAVGATSQQVQAMAAFDNHSGAAFVTPNSGLPGTGDLLSPSSQPTVGVLGSFVPLSR